MCCGSVQLIVSLGIILGKSLKNFQGIDNYTEFDQLSNIDKTSYMLGSEIWEENFVALLSVVEGVHCICVGGKKK